MRLFVAVWPPAAVLDALAGVPRPERPGLRWTTRDQWHVTLRFLGTVDDPSPVAAALEAGLTEVAACEAVVGPTVEALGRHIVSVPVAGLEAIGAAVIAATAGFGAAPDGRPFTGHVTVGRSKRGSVRELAGGPVTGRWWVDEVCLVRSHLEPNGARYETLASFSPGGA